MANLFRQAWMSKGIPAVLAKLGDSVIYTPSAGAPATITVLWEDGETVEQSEPGIAARATIRRSDLAAAPVDGADSITFDGKTYKVVSVGVTNYGMVTLSLRFIGPA